MRTSLAIAALVLLGAVAQAPSPAAAQAPIYRWCMQPSAQRGPDCSFTTIDQCHATASSVGFCYENPAWTVANHGRPVSPRRR
jgi:hypothetical protein